MSLRRQHIDPLLRLISLCVYREVASLTPPSASGALTTISVWLVHWGLDLPGSHRADPSGLHDGSSALSLAVLVIWVGIFLSWKPVLSPPHRLWGRGTGSSSGLSGGECIAEQTCAMSTWREGVLPPAFAYFPRPHKSASDLTMKRLTWVTLLTSYETYFLEWRPKVGSVSGWEHSIYLESISWERGKERLTSFTPLPLAPDIHPSTVGR